MTARRWKLVRWRAWWWDLRPARKTLWMRLRARLKALNAPPAVLFSTLGRIAARALECQLMAKQLGLG